MLVFILIAALGFVYYATVQRTTAHLVARNFVHLNEVSEVLAETIEVMKQVTRFADYYCSSAVAGINEPDGSKKTFIGECLTDRLVASSPYVTEGGQISDGGLPGIVVASAGISISWLPDEADEPDEAIKSIKTLTVPFRNIEGLANSAQYYDTLMIAEDNSGDVFFDSAKLDLHAKPGEPDSYFFDSGSYERYNTIDALVDQWRQINELTRSTGEQKDVNTDKDKKDAERGAAFPQSTIVPVVVGGVDYLAFVQPVSSADLPTQKLYVIGMVRESDFDSDRYSVPLSTSAVSLLFIVVLMFSLSLIRIVLIEENGMVGRWDLYVLLGSALGLVSLLTLLILSLTTWHDLGRSQDENLGLIADRMNFSLQREIYNKVLDMRAVEGEINKNYQQLTDVPKPGPDEATQQPGDQRFFEDTTDCAFASLSCASHGEDTFENALCQASNKSVACKARRLPAFASLFTLDAMGQQRGIYATVRKNPIKSSFNLASRGYFQRTRNGDIWTLYPPEEMGPVAESGPIEFYLDRIKSRSTGQLETVLATGADDQAPWFKNFAPAPGSAFDAVDCSSPDPGQGSRSQCGKDRQGNASESGPSLQLRCEKNEQARPPEYDQALHLQCEKYWQAKPLALVAITSMRSLEEAVLPPGFGYVVIESTTGRVLYHRDQERSLLENFYDVIGHDLKFKTYIATGLPGLVDLAYKGNNIRASVQPLASLPLSVITYYEYQPIRTLIFQFSVYAFLLVLMFLVYQFAVLMLLESLVHYFFGAPTRRRESPVRPMWQLNIALGALSICYLAAGYLLENGLRIIIVLLGPWLVYAVARTFGARFLVWVMSGPSRVSSLWHQNPVLGARWSAFFLSLLLGVLPTLAIFYESMGLHEDSWRRYNNWSDSHAISGRADFFTASMEGLAYSQWPSPAVSINQVLADGSGIYLPHMALWAPGPVQENHPGPASEESVNPETADMAQSDVGGDDSTVIVDCGQGDNWVKIPVYIGSQDVARTRQSEIRIWCKGSAEGPSVASNERRAIQSLLFWIPDMTLMRSMLERFGEVQNSWLTRHDSCSVAASPGGSGEQLENDQHYNFCWQVADKQRQLNYVLREYYPHRRFAGSAYSVTVGLCFALFLGALWLAARQFLNMIAPIRLIQEIRRQAGNEFSIAPPRARSFYSVVPALVGETQKRELLHEIEVQYRLAPLQDELAGPFLSVREEGDYTIALLRNVDTLRDGHPAQRLVREWLLRKEQQGTLCLLVVSRVDLGYLRTRQARGEMLVDDGAGDWELLLTGITCVPFYKLTARVDEAHQYLPGSGKGSRDDTLFIAAQGRSMESREFYRQWELCSRDEKIALASLAHNRVTNVSNVPSLFSLYNRGLITVAPLGINFRIPRFGDYVKSKFPLPQFKAATAGYHDDKWRIFRAPLYILLGAVALFVAYSVQDELSNVFKVFGGFGATLGLIKSIGERYRNTLVEE